MSEQPSKPKQQKPEKDPLAPPKVDAKIIQAFQDLARGEANKDQQLRVLDYLINPLCRTYDLSYRPESERDTVFAEGKRFIGLNIVGLLHRNSMNEPE